MDRGSTETESLNISHMMIMFLHHKFDEEESVHDVIYEKEANVLGNKMIVSSPLMWQSVANQGFVVDIFFESILVFKYM